MRRSTQFIFSLLLALLLALSLSLPALAEEPTAPPAGEPADLALQYGGATSLQFALWEDGKITQTGQRGVYSKTENRALTPDMPYGIGSVSKVYTTVAIMKLVEAGKVKLDTPITTYLPDFKMADERYKKITVRMLLNHSSGLLGSSTHDAFLLDDNNQSATTELLSRLSTQRLKAEPGAFSVYCNDGFTLAELIVEKVSGKSFTAFLQEQIFTPLGLKSSFTPQSDFDRKLMPKAYLTPEETRALPPEALGVIGTGGIYASASDLASFGGALTGTTLLTQASLDAMASPEYKKGFWASEAPDSIAYGLGWDSVKAYPFATSGISALNKGGDTTLYHASLIILPEHNMAAAVVSSGSSSNLNQLLANRLLIDALAAKGVQVDETAPTLPTATAASTPASEQAKMGYYGNTVQQIGLSLNDKGSLLFANLATPSAPAQEFAYYSDGSYRDPTGTIMLKLITEKNGETYLLQQGSSALPGLGYLPIAQYVAQKLSENKISPELQEHWTALETRGFLPLNLRYSSAVYPALGPALAGSEVPTSIPGYFVGLRIVDELTALSPYYIPNGGGRDLQDIQFESSERPLRYTSSQGTLWQEFAEMPTLYADGTAICSIKADGYARWYQIAPNDAGKTMQLQLLSEAGYYLFDEKGTLVASSIYGDSSATLPKDGFLVFAGKPGTLFGLSFTQ